MKKILKSGFLASVSSLLLASPVMAQRIEIEKPENVKITEFSTIISSAIQIALIVAGLLTLAFLIIGGIQWITSGGDKAKYEEARGKITAALIGLIIVAAAWAIMKLIGSLLGIDIFSFELPTLY